ncbi:MAG: S-adenosylmethionine:tRNA ribosyltransferase-isomerase, partial [Nitrospirae bacterium]|nr:S-adenosylmethionine:tRNA ribosyltransferase-isomerase [Nitrospirota bacterium]
MKTADFDFHLPDNLIALHPTEKRDHSRLLVLHKDGAVEHRMFYDLPYYLKKGDMILINDTKVFPARIIGRKKSGGRIDLLLVERTGSEDTWEILYKGNYTGEIKVAEDIRAEIWTGEDQWSGDGCFESRHKRFLRFLDVDPSAVMGILWQYGYMPLPPYIKRAPDEDDRERYQTVYAEEEGSIAAPTAGMHFTAEMIERLVEKGVIIRKLTLHVGVGTFRPVRADRLSEHKMETEYFQIETSLINEI